MVDLTVLCPAIRTDRWLGLYESIRKSYSGTWELILITEMEVPQEVKEKENVRIIYSQRAPLQKQQEGLCQAEGEWILNISDDQLYIEGALDKAFKHIDNYKTIVVMKYLEGPEFEYPEWHQKQRPFKTNYDFMRSEQYYLCGTHQSSKYKYVPPSAPILSCCLISRQVLGEIGGWDCAFQTQAIGNIDLSVRLMKYGCKYVINYDVVETCGHMPGIEGDHSALHYAQINHDEPLLKEMYDSEECTRDIYIPINNWKQTDDVWEKRTSE